MQPSEVYRLIWKAVRERQQVAFIYNGGRREACPLILGYAADGREALMAYQFAGTTSRGSTLPNWRCFYLANVKELQVRPGEWHEGTSHTTAQTCVRFVDVDVNIPATLTREAPLPFGSPLLRRPRTKS